jgi:hypothetical protein
VPTQAASQARAPGGRKVTAALAGVAIAFFLRWLVLILCDIERNTRGQK